MVVIIVGPLLMPAFALAVARKCILPSLSDLAFGFVAVAFAGTARAAVTKSDAWLTYTVIASLVVGLQTAIAVSVDTAVSLEKLQKVLASLNGQNALSNVPRLQDLNQTILEQGANTPQFLVSIIVGISFVIVSLELIRRER